MMIEVEFEADSELNAKAALMRVPGGLRNVIEHGSGQGVRTGVKSNSVKVHVKNKAIDGKAVP